LSGNTIDTIVEYSIDGIAQDVEPEELSRVN